MFLVEPENWKAVQAFLTVQSQFRKTGFRYEGVKAGLDLAGIFCSSDCFARLQVMELAACSRIAELDQES